MTEITPLHALSAVGPGAAPRPAAPADPSTDESIRAAAAEFEAAYLAEMLTHAGLAAPRTSFGGGAGEDAFASLLARAWADKLVDNGGVGLADRVAESMMRLRGGDA